MTHPGDDTITNDAPAAQRIKLMHGNPPVGLSQLPSSLVSGRIFDFLADVQSPQFLRDGLDLIKYKASLTPLAGVCREWRDHAKVRVVHAKSVSCSLDMHKGTAKSILKRATKEGAPVLELKLVMGDIHEAGLLREKYTVRTNSGVPVALETASRLCPTVKSLGLLCGPMNHEGENWESFPKMATALLDALGRWHAANGGLRALMMPAFVSHEESVYERFIRTVAACCPQIEYLVSSTTTQGDMEMQEDWPTLSVDAWAEFCRQCPLLREMAWNIAPMTTEHMEAFAATPKLQLQDLKLFNNTNDPWPVDHTVLGRVLDAVSRLTSLYVAFDGEEEDESDEEDEDGAPKAKVTMPTKIAGVVAAKCPKLEEIFFDGTTDEWIHRMSGEAAEALVKLPSAALLELPLVFTMGNQTFANTPWQEDLKPLERLLDAAPRLGSLDLEFGGELEDDDEDPTTKGSVSSKIVSLVVSKCPRLEHISAQDASHNRAYGISGEAVDALVKLESAYSLELPSVSSVNDQTLVEMLRSTLNSTEYSSRTVEIGADDYVFNAINEMLQFMEKQPAKKFEDMSLELIVRGSYRENERGSIIMPKPDRKLKPKPLEKLVEAVKQKPKKALSYIHVDVATKHVSNRVLQYVEEFHLLLNVSKSGVKAFKKAREYDNYGYEPPRFVKEITEPVGGVGFQKEPPIQYY